MEGDVDGSAGILSVSVIRSSSSTFSCAVVSLSDAAACGSVRRRRSAVAVLVLVLVLSPVCDGGAERMEQAVVFEGPSAGCRERGRSARKEDLGGGEGGTGRGRGRRGRRAANREVGRGMQGGRRGGRKEPSIVKP